ncbi:Glycosyltransferase sugar-binding region containing DXD motif-containing protein [Brevinema andersonii]|uniref:Glycosyltransferase sugar-binding region containing DXD motif-containing protein n=1 Tax=Brevinema andersonii TaxID=34097 RepID=A0A1I1E9E8_BREAD|nr:glycosyltransferase [Brevinema andersonii]SFB83697.1 Glycosyltransferase sugar-binding region containing DXD motif-containing protein [Brevinema andersonii]
MASQKNGAFLSDYFRWWVLREYGGIYLDADIEIVNGEKFNQVVEELEQGQHHSFMGFSGNGLPTYDWIAESVGSKKTLLYQCLCVVYMIIWDLYLIWISILLQLQIY